MLSHTHTHTHTRIHFCSPAPPAPPPPRTPPPRTPPPRSPPHTSPALPRASPGAQRAGGWRAGLASAIAAADAPDAAAGAAGQTGARGRGAAVHRVAAQVPRGVTFGPGGARSAADVLTLLPDLDRALLLLDVPQPFLLDAVSLGLPAITPATPRAHQFGGQNPTKSYIFVPLVLQALTGVPDDRAVYLRSHVFGAVFWDALVVRITCLIRWFNVHDLQRDPPYSYVDQAVQEWVLGLDGQLRAITLQGGVGADLKGTLDTAVQLQETAAAAL